MRGEKILWVLAILGLIIGAPFLYLRLTGGLNSTALTSWVPWGLWVIGYTYFIGLSAGAFLLSTLIYVFDVAKLKPIGKLSLLTALITLLAAMISIQLSLGHIERVHYLIFSNSFSSLMGWMGILYIAYCILLLWELWVALRVDLVNVSRSGGSTAPLAKFLLFGQEATDNQSVINDGRLLKILGIIGVPLAVCFHGGVGALFGVVGALPYWNSALFPIIFLVGALLSGGALLTALSNIAISSESQRQEIIPLLGKIVLVLLVGDIILEIADFLVHLYANIPAHTHGLQYVLFGPTWWLFWVVHIALGVVVPIFILARFNKKPAGVAFASFLIAVTFFAVRYNITVPGQLKPQLEGIDKAFQEPRLYFHYTPNMVEWSVVLWIAAFALFLFLVIFKSLPIMSTKKEAR